MATEQAQSIPRHLLQKPFALEKAQALNGESRNHIPKRIQFKARVLKVGTRLTHTTRRMMLHKTSCNTLTAAEQGAAPDRLRSLGSAPSRLFGNVTTTDWSTVFDGVVVVRDEAAPTF